MQQRRSHFQKTILLQNEIGPPIPPSRQRNNPNVANGQLLLHQIQNHHQNSKSRCSCNSIVKLIGCGCFIILLSLITLLELHHTTTSSSTSTWWMTWLFGSNSNNSSNSSNISKNSLSQPSKDNDSPNQDTTNVQKITTAMTTTTIDTVRQEFYQRYGGQALAQQIYQRGIQSFGSDNHKMSSLLSDSRSLYHTAERLLRIVASTSTSTNNKKQLVLSFAGYSVTVGRGNHYNQSYPFVLQRILQPLLSSEFDGMELIVRNAAIGGIPSFPYGFCFSHFLGSDANGISWDYSMNEGKSSTVLEAYLRQSQAQLAQTQPMMIVLDTNHERCQLLNKYIDSELLLDGICVGMAKDAVPDLKNILSQPHLPAGFQNWDEFGASPNCPGRGNWHPKRMEHELIGWMMAMYFVDAIQLAKQIISEHPNDWNTLYDVTTANAKTKPIQFPPPLTMTSLPQNNDMAVTNLLYGHETSIDSTTKSQYTMNHVSCRTNFLPAIDIENVLSSIIVDGFNEEMTSENIMTPRSDDMYEHGWVLDVSNVERDTKVKVEQCGGLGYIDMKISLYGIPKSGALRLWLPIESSQGHGSTIDATSLATNYFSEFIICEANEKRKDGACRLDTDMEYIVGGSTKKLTPTMIHGAGEYLKRPTCVHIGIPEDAVVTPLKEVRPIHPNVDTNAMQRRLTGTKTDTNSKPKYDLHQIGLTIDIRAKDNVSRDKGACCISHVVWGEKQIVV